MKRRFESLGPIATVDGRTLFALRNRSFPTGGRATAQTIVRLTLAR
jgi:hypothetical protein